MGQVPSNESKPKYLIVGSGKLAKHFIHYFDLIGVTYLHCTRKNLADFVTLAATVEKIILLIPDDQIENFIANYKSKIPQEKIWIHCSGMLSIEEAESAHPLASFSEVLFDFQFYRTIPFVTEKGRKNFQELFPELQNPSLEIRREDKELYHAWCSMAGNFTTILWLQFFRYLEIDLNIPRQAAHQFISSISENLFKSADPLTGPLKRNDKNTIERHLKQLRNHSFENVYKSFVDLFKSSQL